MWLIVTSELRRRRMALALLVVLCAVWLGVAATAMAGARRTGSAVARFERRSLMSDAPFSVASRRPEDAEALQRAVRARSEVVSSDGVWQAGTGLAYDRGIFVGLVAPVEGVWGTEMDRPIVLQGRLADPSTAEEVTLTSDAADLLRVGPGDEISIPTWDSAELSDWYFSERGPHPAFNGPRPRVRVVGIVRVVSDLTADADSRFVVLATPAFRDRWGEEIGSEGTLTVATLRDGAGIETMVEELTEELDLKVVGADSHEDLEAARSATRTLSTGLWVLAGAVALSGGVLALLAMTYELRLSVDRHRPLAALGVTRAQQTLVLMTPIGIALAAATLVAAVGAVISSAQFPIGTGRVADPDPSMAADWPVLAGVLAMVVVVAGMAALVGARPIGRGDPAARPRTVPGGVIDVVGPVVALGTMAPMSRDRRLVVCGGGHVPRCPQTGCGRGDDFGRPCVRRRSPVGHSRRDHDLGLRDGRPRYRRPACSAARAGGRHPGPGGGHRHRGCMGHCPTRGQRPRRLRDLHGPEGGRVRTGARSGRRCRVPWPSVATLQLGEASWSGTTGCGRSLVRQ